MKYHTNNNIGELRAAAEKGKIVYLDHRRDNVYINKKTQS